MNTCYCKSAGTHNCRNCFTNKLETRCVRPPLTVKELHEKFELLDENEIYEYLDLLATWMPSDEWDYLMKQRIKVEEKRKRSTL